MRNNVVGTIISIIVLFIGLVILPTYYNSMIQQRDDAVTVQTATRNFIDTVIDSKQITKEALAEFNLQLSACSTIKTYDIYREQKVVNPDGSGGYTISWVHTPVDVGDIWSQGDIITVVVSTSSYSIHERISMLMLGAYAHPDTCRLSGMIR